MSEPTAPPSSPSTPPPTAPTGYEFTAAQNAVVADLANGLAWSSGPLIGLGILYVIAAAVAVAQGVFHSPFTPALLINGLLILLLAVFVLFMGSKMSAAAAAFRGIVDTQGSDIPHLMTALNQLRRLYAVLRAIIQAYILLVVVALVASLVLMLFGPRMG